jgi:hypothetical protein
MLLELSFILFVNIDIIKCFWNDQQLWYSFDKKLNQLKLN